MKFLIVDNEPKVCKNIELILNNISDSNQIQIATNAEEAILLLKKFNADIIFTDIRMGEIDGLMFIRKVKKFLPKTCFIIISGYDLFEYAIEGINLEVVDYVLKPITVKKIETALKKAYEKIKILNNEIEKTKELQKYCVKRLLEEKNFCLERECLRYFENYTYFEILFIKIDQKNSISKNINEFLKKISDKAENVIGINIKNLFCMVLCNIEGKKIEKKILAKIEEIFSYKVNIICSERFFSINEIKRTYKNYVSCYENKLVNIESKAIKDALQYIEEHYNEKITLEVLAKELYLNESYLSKLFKKEIGLNFSDFLNNIRIEKSKKLLLENNYKIYEIADKVGFSNSKYFISVFKNKTGKTPKEYSKNLI